MGLIPGVAALVLFPLARNLLHSTQLFKWVPADKWESKCQTALHVLLMGVVQVGFQVTLGMVPLSGHADPVKHWDAFSLRH